MSTPPTHVFHRNARVTPPAAVRGDGVYLIDAAGNRYLDACGGAAVSCLGHSHPAVIDAIKAQLDKLSYMHTGFFTNPVLEELADYLIAAAPGGLDRVYFTCGGSESTEAAIKLARQYFWETGERDRWHIIARRQSYHGNTLGALAAGGNASRRAPFEPLLMEVPHISPCYAYRGMRNGEDETAYGRRVADELEAEITRLGAETVAAFICEPVVGATAGAVPAVDGYLARIRETCDAHGVLLIFDEVMCGMGRTGYRFACDHDGVAPDILTTAKGLGAGYQPIGAVLASKTICDAIEKGSGVLQHGHTYMGHPLACAASLAVQKAIDAEGLLDNVRRKGEALKAALASRLGQHPHVGDIRGRGLFLGIELVEDRDSKEPFDPALKLNQRIKAAAMAGGLMVYPGGGTADGVKGDHILLAPPFILEDAHIDPIVDGVAQAIDTAIRDAA